MSDISNNPLVSIIVRTKDRPKLLKKALQSITAQTYRPIEVVLVNDGGCDLDVEDLKTILRDVSLHYIRLEKNTGRAHAGNVGMKNAKGKYIGFLDDDDEFYPEHVRTLCMGLETIEYKIAYSDVEMITKQFSIDENDFLEIRRSIFSKDFSYSDLLISNYIPFNSVLFHKEIIGKIGFLDKQFDLYEDWDFLIRIGEEFPFYHIKKVTAIYNQWSQDLQINQKDRDFTRRMHINVMNKYHEKITSETILNVWLKCLQKDTAIAEKDAAIAEKDTTIAEKDAAIAEKDAAIAEKDAAIAEKDAAIAEKDAAIAEKDAAIAKKDTILEEKDIMIAHLKANITQLETNINLIYETFGWQLLERFRRFRERYFPYLTRRGKIYDLGMKSIKYAQREGLRRFIKKVLQRLNVPTTIRHKEPYEVWISKNEPNSTILKEQKTISKEFHFRPKISIITPVFNPERNAFVEMIESVMNQTYDNWELCLSNASTESRVEDTIKKYLKRDKKRIKVKYLNKNHGIPKNSNEALSLATGDFVALLDHDDMLSPYALFEVVKTINDHPDVDFVYSDRDKISHNGKRFDPFFKPDWSPDYLLSQNYLCHLNVFRKILIDKMGGFREGYDGSQDYDLVLRITELTDKIVHIPKILYHYRVVPGSASGDPNAKPYAYDSAIKALQDAMSRRGWKGTATQGMIKGLYRIKFQFNSNPKVSITIPSKDKSHILKKCVDSILNKTTYKNYEIIIVDNQSREEKTFEYYTELKNIHKIKLLEYANPFNFSEINNYAVSQIDTEYIIFLNNDIEVITEEWIEFMLGFAQRKETGAVGAKLLYPNDTIQHAGLILDDKGNVRRSHHRYPRYSLGYAGRILSIQNVSAVAAACMMIRREVFTEVGGFDPQFVIAHGDIDFCLKLRDKNYLILYEPHAELYHHESLTRGYEDTLEKVERLKKETDLLLRKWGHVLKKGDPYFNPNLTADNEDFSIRV